MSTGDDATPYTRPDPASTASSGGVPGGAPPQLAATRPVAPPRAFGAAPRLPQVGSSFGAYDLVAELGRGGMGAVFRARERATGRHVALKVLLEAVPEGEALERFQREGQLAASLDHPGIIRIHTAGEVDGVPFLACELIEGARDL